MTSERRKRTATGTTVLAAAMLVVCAGAPLSAPPVHAMQHPPGQGVLAFLTDRGSSPGVDNDDIYVTTDLGRTAVRVTSDPAVDSFPAVSHDGRQLAWISERDTAAFPNPDGLQQLFVCRLRLPRPGCAGVRRLTDPSDGSALQPTWTPDDTTLLYVLAPTGTSGDDIYKQRIHGNSPAVRLFADGDGPTVHDFQPTVSPDGRTVLWGRNGTLWAGRLDGSVIGPWTTLPGSNPDYSPDGKRIVFSANRKQPVDGTDTDVFTMRAEPESPSNPAVNLTGGLRRDGGPSWDKWARYSPDGTWVAFWSSVDGGIFDGETFVMCPDGSHKTNITHDDPIAETFLDWGGKTS